MRVSGLTKPGRRLPNGFAWRYRDRFWLRLRPIDLKTLRLKI